MRYIYELYTGQAQLQVHGFFFFFKSVIGTSKAMNAPSKNLDIVEESKIKIFVS
jgi:hypothetical protein